MKSERKAFTLIELLVVISIIALLLAIMMPALSMVKEKGKRVVCLSNQRQLGMAWRTYATNNDGKICSPFPDGPAADRACSWIAWPAAGGSPSGWSQDSWEYAIHEGSLWPYLKSEGVYRCPAGERDEQITYTGFGSMGWQIPYNRASDGPIYKKLSAIPQPSTRSVFIDEGELTSAFYSVYYNEPKWWDQPPMRHNEGVTLAFADGHADYWKWRDSRTIEMCQMTWEQFQNTWQHKDCRDNEDLTKLREAAWGKLPAGSR